MFWKVTDQQGVYLGPLVDIIDPVLTQEVAKIDVLTFGIGQGTMVKAEYVIETEDDRYRVKGLDSGKITAVQDLDDLERKGFDTFLQETKTVAEVLVPILDGTGWTAEIDPSIGSTRRTIEDAEGTNAVDLLAQMTKKFGIEIWYNAKLKKVYVSLKRGVYRGTYFTSELNLSDFEVVEDTFDFYTRVYATGAEGMTFADINGGLPYVENLSYTTRIIPKYWKDERYTVKESLLADATAMVNDHAIPRISYQFKVSDLSDKPEYLFLSYEIGDTVDILDSKTNTAIRQRVVGHKKNPITKKSTDIMMATPMLTYTAEAKKQLAERVEEVAKTVGTIRDATIEHVTVLLQNAVGGHVLHQGGELFIMDNEDPNLAEKVWRWNLNGLGYSGTGVNGPYETAMTMDGTIAGTFIQANSITANKLSADFGQDLNLEGNESVRIIAEDEAKSRIASITSNVAPVLPTLNQLWLDSSGETILLKRWDGAVWQTVNDPAEVIGSLEALEGQVGTLTSEIAAQEGAILLSVAETYATQENLDAFAGSVSTQFTETARAFNFQFETITGDVSNLDSQIQGEFTTLKQNIRFEAGKIILGQSNSPMTVEISNTKISFLQSGSEVAYISNNILYILDGRFLNSLRIGNFSFRPRSNGSLSFGKVV